MIRWLSNRIAGRKKTSDISLRSFDEVIKALEGVDSETPVRVEYDMSQAVIFDTIGERSDNFNGFWPVERGTVSATRAVEAVKQLSELKRPESANWYANHQKYQGKDKVNNYIEFGTDTFAKEHSPLGIEFVYMHRVRLNFLEADLKG